MTQILGRNKASCSSSLGVGAVFRRLFRRSAVPRTHRADARRPRPSVNVDAAGVDEALDVLVA